MGRFDVDDDLSVYDWEITYDELKSEVESETKAMSEEERHIRLVNCDPTFLEYCLSCFSQKNATKGIINEFTYEINITETNNKI